jgi:hypothetical protein
MCHMHLREKMEMKFQLKYWKIKARLVYHSSILPQYSYRSIIKHIFCCNVLGIFLENVIFMLLSLRMLCTSDACNATWFLDAWKLYMKKYRNSLFFLLLHAYNTPNANSQKVINGSHISTAHGTITRTYYFLQNRMDIQMKLISHPLFE